MASVQRRPSGRNGRTGVQAEVEAHDVDETLLDVCPPALVDLDPRASVGDQIAAILEAGVTVEELTRLVDVSSSSIHNWRSGKAVPRADAALILDDARQAVLVLREAGAKDHAPGRWLRGRNRQLGNERPLDVLRSDPMRVLAAAELLVVATPQGFEAARGEDDDSDGGDGGTPVLSNQT
jgi:hypothetical protein